LKKTFLFLIILFILVSQSMYGHAQEPDDDLQGLQIELKEYIKPWQDKITLHYKNLISEVSYEINNDKKMPAASTIKLPLALYVMKLADQRDIDISEKLTYMSHHYYEGSGVIQNDKIGTSYTIEDLVEKAMVYSDNIAFIMLKERVGQDNFIQFMKSLGAKYTYPGGQNVTSAGDLILYAKEVYQFSKKSNYGEKLIKYLENTIHNTTIPQGIPDKKIAHKVGMIPKDLIYNDVAIVYGKVPFGLAVTTMGIGYEKSQEVIAGIANIVNKHHELIVKKYLTVEVPESKLESIYLNGNTTPGNDSMFLTKEFFGKYIKPWSTDNEVEKVTYYHRLVTLKQFLVTNPTIVKESWEAAAKKAEAEQLKKSIRITFAGDAMMDWSVKETVKQKGPDYPFIHIKEELSSSDLSVVNLETAITTEGVKVPKEYNFRSDPISLTGLKNAGFQLVSLANNHSFDYGPSGFTDTLSNLKKYQLDYMGGGADKEEAYSAKTYSIKGRNIKVLAFSRVLPDFSWLATDTKPGLANGYDLTLIQNTIEKEKKDADFLFIYIHWGVETERSPEAFQRDWAKTMIDSGADGVIGSHPHVLQGFEYYKGKPIAYSLGNFLFPNYIKGDKAQTGILHLDIQKNNIEMSFVPFRIIQDQIIVQTEQEKQVVWDELRTLSYGEVQINNGIISDSRTIVEAKGR
jgi:poly-gamma-glutamate capsule biosynthesis protein CapA/YwtB (metallophosphatase superfamily)